MTPRAKGGEGEILAVQGTQIQAIMVSLSEIKGQIADLDRKMDAVPPMCARHEERLKVVEREVDTLRSTVVWRTWESRSLGALTALVAAVAAAFASAFTRP